MKVSFGQGNLSKVPWVALRAPDMPVSNGYNPVYLFYKEQNILAKEQAIKSEEGSDEQEKKQTGKTDDPVRLYLRDMGAVELLSREGEIAIAKRIDKQNIFFRFSSSSLIKYLER